MSVPHLDKRFIDGKAVLLFGPFAGFSPNFVNSQLGSPADLLASMNPWNVTPMCAAGLQNLDLGLGLGGGRDHESKRRKGGGTTITSGTGMFGARTSFGTSPTPRRARPLARGAMIAPRDAALPH